MKFAAGITLYNPNEQQIRRIASYTKTFDRVFLFDNSEPEYCKPEYPKSNKIRVLTLNANMGLPYAFNSIIDCCEGYDFLCILDQDSVFEAEDIKRLQSFIMSLNDLSIIGIVAPFVDLGYKLYNPSENVDIRKWVITSGSFVNLNVIRREGIRYDENYFIDKCDIDFCYQLRSFGYSILMYHNSTLHQSLGEESKRGKTNHNAIRHYYIFKSRYYFNNKWHRGLKKWFLNISQTLKHLIIILLLETERTKKLRSFIEAVKDSIR